MTPQRLLIAIAILVSTRPLEAAYVDPAGTSMLLRILVPLFILLSAFGFHFKRALFDFLKRRFRRGEGGERSAP